MRTILILLALVAAVGIAVFTRLRAIKRDRGREAARARRVERDRIWREKAVKNLNENWHQ